jgi:2-dehydropantoate 2-reductase
MKKTKIIIAGIGGVGGYFGGLLANHFYDNENVEISFVARGAHLKEIQKNGLKVIKGENEFIAKPYIATDNTSEIGIVDFIVIATKSYDLETIIKQLLPCINQDTIILPLLNGVDSKERIKNILPDNIVLEGCAYIVSRLKQFGVIENSGNIQTLYFGLDNIVNDKFILLENLFKVANIEAYQSKNISSIIWEKFIFISPTATATSYFDKCIGDVLSNKEHFETIMKLIEEVKQIAKAKQIVVSEDITEKTVKKLKALPFETTSSMHSDFKNKKSNTELQSLTGFVLSEGMKYNIDTPIYKKIHSELKKKSDIIA